MLADYFPFFLGVSFSLLLYYFSSVRCEDSLVNVYVFVCAHRRRGATVLMGRLGVGLNKR